MQPREVNRSQRQHKPLYLHTDGTPLEHLRTRQDPRRRRSNPPGVRMEYGFLAFEQSPPESREPIFVRTIRQVHHDTETDVAIPDRDETITTLSTRTVSGACCKLVSKAKRFALVMNTSAAAIASCLPNKAPVGVGTWLVRAIPMHGILMSS